MRRKQYDGVFTRFVRKFGESLFDILGYGLRKTNSYLESKVGRDGHTSINPGCVPHRSITLHSISGSSSPALLFLNSSFRLLPVVLQLYCGYWVNAIALLTPSAFISRAVSAVSGRTYLNATYALCGAVAGCSSSSSRAIPSPWSRV